MGAAAAREHSMASFEVLTRNLEPAFAIFADSIRNAVFPESEVAREKKIHLDSLLQQANSPNAIAGRLRSILLFGPEHPYGRPAHGLPSSVETIERQDLVNFHREQWKPASTALVMSGDISLDEAVALAERHFGSWSGGAAAVVPIPAAMPLGPGKLFAVDRQDAPQTVIVQLLPAPTRTAEDFSALRLADAIWGGGGFRTRLNLNLREDKGYAYGVFTTLVTLTRAGAWWAAGSVQTDKTRESIVEFERELHGLTGERPITEEELTEAKEMRIRGYSQQFESASRIASQVAELWILGLPMSELQREVDEAARATLPEVEAAARKYADPARATMLLVGDLRRIGGSPDEVTILDVEGNVVAVAGVR
jgi:zinc protease